MEPLPFSAWESFYVIVGSSGGALTGLQFVVMAIVADGRRRSTSHEISAFGTPTVVHFCAVLLVSAIMSAPWQTVTSVSITLGLCGVAGLLYGVIVVQRARHQTFYRPVPEDWLWHAVLPLISYGLFLTAAIFLRSYARQVLFAVGGGVLLLLFIGIHNSWDTVTYIAVTHAHKKSEEQKPESQTEQKT